jgi:ribonuclease HII
VTVQKPGGSIRRASRVSAGVYPNIRHERDAWSAGFSVVAGVDEVGRGAWAGPLVAAALVLPREPASRSLLTRRLNRAGVTPRDSKLLSHDVRVRIVDVLHNLDIASAVAVVQPAEIDESGVGVANELALCRAVSALGNVEYALVDAFDVDGLDCARRPVLGGDRVCLSIALASIVAKVHRDQMMLQLDETYPEFGFGKHKGYGTQMHSEALDAHGVTAHHRRSFRPVAERVERR